MQGSLEKWREEKKSGIKVFKDVSTKAQNKEMFEC